MRACTVSVDGCNVWMYVCVHVSVYMCNYVEIYECMLPRICVPHFTNLSNTWNKDIATDLKILSYLIGKTSDATQINNCC